MLERNAQVEVDGDITRIIRPVKLWEVEAYRKEQAELRRQREEADKPFWLRGAAEVRKSYQTPPPQTFRFSAPAHHFGLVINAAKVTGVRLEALAFPKELYTVKEGIDWEILQHVTVKRKAGDNEIVYDARARNLQHYETFGDCYDSDLTFRPDLWKAPEGGPGVFWTSRAGRLVAFRWHGSIA